MKEFNRVLAKIDLDAIEYNLDSMSRSLDPKTKVMAVIKADGYGHGAIQIAQMLEDKDVVWGYAVATLEEAIALKESGVKKPLMILGVLFEEQWEEAIRQKIRMTVYTEETAAAISELAKELGTDAVVHVKLDTGMSRLGFMVNEESFQRILRICQMPNLKVEGLFTHFAKADEKDKTFTHTQLESYNWMRDRLMKAGVHIPYYHVSNSAGIIDVPEANLDLVRAGISLYGLYPSDEVQKENVPLKPALSLISHVAYVKWVDQGTPVSYGGTYVTTKRTRIATIPVGYGDGYPRSLSNKGYVLIRGQKAPILGRVCMDQFMVDVTDIPDTAYKDKVTLVGTDGKEEVSVADLSRLSGRFNYEFVCDLGKRIPREFIRHGKAFEQVVSEDYVEIEKTRKE